jgi:hypothetical protein
MSAVDAFDCFGLDYAYACCLCVNANFKIR